MKSPIMVLAYLLFFVAIEGSCSSPAQDPSTYIKTIDVVLNPIQRSRTQFKIQNKSEGVAGWKWEISNSETGKTVATSTEQSPTFSLPEGAYDIVATAKGKNELSRHFRRAISVLPKVFTERQADEVIDLSKETGSTFTRDFGNKKRPGYKIVMKGKFSGKIKFTGLRGTKKNPVHIINKGQVEVVAGNDSSPYAFTWSDNNQYILLDGKADPSIPYGFIVRGHPKKSGQVFFIAGIFNRGFEICGVNLIGNQGKTHGAAAIQLQTSYEENCHAGNWNFEYFRFHNNKIQNASSEGMYIGYFTDDKRDNGLVPYRLGEVTIYRDTIVNSGWDAIQIASADEFEVHDNYIDGAALSGKRSHSSFISWNNGNKAGYLYRNTLKNGAHAASVFFGGSGKEAFIYSNLFVEGTFPETINTPGFFFSKLYNERQDVGLYIFHNTIITSRISAKIDYRNTREEAKGIPLVYAANAIVQNRLNLKNHPEIAMGRNMKDSLSWSIDNVWRMEEKASDLMWDNNYHPLPGSPLLKTNFDITSHLAKLKGGFYDRDGYPLKHEEYGYTSGCYSAYQISEEKNTPQNGVH